jgi:hypothetical protein
MTCYKRRSPLQCHFLLSMASIPSACLS